jgi:hypothetical protein
VADTTDFERTDRPDTAQPPPVPNEAESTHISAARMLREMDVPGLAADLEARGEYGVRKYGTALQPHNGRNWPSDLYEELLDGLAYLEQGIRESPDPELVEPALLIAFEKLAGLASAARRWYVQTTRSSGPQRSE